MDSPFGSTAESDPNVRPIPNSMGSFSGGESRYGGARGTGKKEGKYFTVITALIPYRQQLEEYISSLGPSGYDFQRDSPNYVNWKLQRNPRGTRCQTTLEDDWPLRQDAVVGAGVGARPLGRACVGVT